MGTEEQIKQFSSKHGLSPTESDLLVSDLFEEQDTKACVKYEGQDFKSWVSCARCMNCSSHHQVQAVSMYEDGTEFDLGFAIVDMGHWAVVPICDICLNQRNFHVHDLPGQLRWWLCHHHVYVDTIGHGTPASIHLAMLKSLAETLGFNAKFEPKERS